MHLCRCSGKFTHMEGSRDSQVKNLPMHPKGGEHSQPADTIGSIAVLQREVKKGNPP